MASKIDAKALAERYKLAVEEQLSLVAKIDETNDVVFKHPDLGTFYFSLDAEDDPEYLMLVFPNFVDKDATGGDKTKLLEAVNKVNRKSKGVKLSIRDDADANVIATVECFVAASDEGPSQEFLDTTIKRTFSAMRACVGNLVEEIKNSSGGGDKKTPDGEKPATSSM